MFIEVERRYVGKNDTDIIHINANNIDIIFDNAIGIGGQIVLLTNGSLEKVKLAALPKKRERKSDEPAGERADFFRELNELTGGGPRVIFSKAMQSRLSARLEEGIAKEDLIAAATLLGQDPWWQGENDKNTRYGTIEWLLRNSENVQKALAIKPQKKKGMF